MKNIFASLFGKRVHSRRVPGVFSTMLAVLAGGFLLTGCLSRPALKTEMFAFDVPAAVGNNAVATAPVLGIKSITVAAPFAGRPLVYRTGEFSYERDPYAAFLDFPDKELAAPLKAGLGGRGDFSSVVAAGSALEPRVMVEINVSQLYGDFRERSNPQAVLRAQFIFYQATNGIATGMIWQKEYSRSLPLKKMTAAALMAGWNQALNEILSDALTDYRQLKK